MRPSLLSIALCLALPGLAAAQSVPAADATPPGDAAATEFDRVVVTATRTERPIADVPNTVDLIGRERMDALIVRDLRDLFRYEPGITVTSGFGRFGIGGVRVRGLDGNRVRMLVDGIPVSDAFSIGSFSNANRNFVDLDTLKRVEVVRGPSSALYGSDALGGTVSFITKDPSDYLRGDDRAYLGLKFGYRGEDNGLFAGATGAFGGPRWSGLVSVGQRQGQERENQGTVGGTGSARTRPNPQETDGRSLLSRLVFAPGQGQRFRLTVEGNEDGTRTNLLTNVGFQALTRATNTRVVADDHQTRARVSLAHEWDDLGTAFADSMDWQVYRQQSETTQDTLEQRTLPPPTLRDIRARSFNFDQRTDGLQANFRKSIEAGGAVHDLAYGLDLSRTRTRQKRDGLRTFPLTGVQTPVMSPDVFPVRDFPNSTTTVAALYVQDEIALAGGALRLVPAVRVDRYDLSPQVDNIFREDNPGVATTGLTETAVSPKLGAVWHFAPQWSLFGGYARGFRAPPYNDVNIGFTNVQFGYTAIANPGLKSETSDGLEAGLRFSGRAAYAGLTTYYNRYDDFIQSLAVVGFDPVRQLTIFQSRNVAEATIYGVELKAGASLGELADGLEGWSVQGAAAWSRGNNDTDGVPLDSVDPPTATLGLRYDRDAWGAELAGRFVRQRDRVSDPALYTQPGHGVLDVYAHWTLAPGARIDIGVTNLGDRKYSYAGDVALSALASSASLDRFTAPGRSVSASFSAAW